MHTKKKEKSPVQKGFQNALKIGPVHKYMPNCDKKQVKSN